MGYISRHFQAIVFTHDSGFVRFDAGFERFGLDISPLAAFWRLNERNPRMLKCAGDGARMDGSLQTVHGFPQIENVEDTLAKVRQPEIVAQENGA